MSWPPAHTRMPLALIEQGPITSAGSPISKGAALRRTRLPFTGSSSRIEPATPRPPVGTHKPGLPLHVPPTLVLLLTTNSRFPSNTAPPERESSAWVPTRPHFACHASAPLSCRKARNQPSLFHAPTRPTPPPSNRTGLVP